MTRHSMAARSKVVPGCLLPGAVLVALALGFQPLFQTKVSVPLAVPPQGCEEGDARTVHDVSVEGLLGGFAGVSCPEHWVRVKGFFFIDDGVKRLYESREELVKSAWDNRMPRSLDVDFRYLVVPSAFHKKLVRSFHLHNVVVVGVFCASRDHTVKWRTRGSVSKVTSIDYESVRDMELAAPILPQLPLEPDFPSQLPWTKAAEYQGP